jgi:hypothetical protein
MPARVLMVADVHQVQLILARDHPRDADRTQLSMTRRPQGAQVIAESAMFGRLLTAQPGLGPLVMIAHVNSLPCRPQPRSLRPG